MSLVGMPRRMSLLLGALLFAILAAGGCSKGTDAAKLKDHNVLFVTLDTTRADRLGCYGYGKALTPTLDALAARGTLFEQTFTPVCLTLPSHSSIMTGLYPREHGVRDNGVTRLGKQATLATLFKQHGYRTGAFVASFVLDAQFGLDQGFDIYRDEMDRRKAGDNPLDAEQPADVITDRALEWLNEDTDTPFFAWVHYYDAHDPYAPPPAFQFPDGRPYDGELAFVDSQLKRLIECLKQKNILDRTLIVVVGDHGESFQEHGEGGHTNFTYETNLHVPMILAHPAVVPAGKRVKEIVETVDIYPSILQLFGWELPRPLLSKSLVPPMSGAKADGREAYSETLYVFNQYGWAEQRSLTAGRWKYISSTKPELYDRIADPGETKNLVLDEPRVASDMYDNLHEMWESMIPGGGEEANLSPEARRKLQSLGYMAGGAANASTEQFLTAGLRDPKDMKEVVRMHLMARELLDKAVTPQDFQSALPLLRDLVINNPRAVQFYYTYANCLIRAHHPDEAIPVLDKAITELGARQSQMFLLKADALRQLGRSQEALAEYDVAVELDPESVFAREGYAAALNEAGRTAEAVEQARKAIELDPRSPSGHARLCSVLSDPQELAKAVEDFRKTIGDTPADAAWHWRLGEEFQRLGRSDEAVAELEKAVKLGPEMAAAKLALGSLRLQRKEFEAARAAFQQVAQMDGHAAEGLYYLGVTAAQEGDAGRAASLYESALEKDPAYAEALIELTRYYRRGGKLDQSVRVLRRATEAAPDKPIFLSALGQILATTQQTALRDCPGAVALLERASKLAGGRDALILANLAAAYACVERYDDAVKAVQEALALGDAGQEERLRRQLELHKNHEPYVDPNL